MHIIARILRRIPCSATFTALALSCSAALQSAQAPAVAGAQVAPAPAKAPASQPEVTRESLAGVYDGGQMEVAAQLLLGADGYFEYALGYGALDEEAKGTWEVKDGAVLLTTVPAVNPPRFVVVKDTPEPRGGLWITLSRGPVMQGARQRIYLLYAPNEPADMAEVGDDGSVPLQGNRRPIAFIPEIPVYPIESKPIPLTGTGGHRIVLRFEPNDIGRANFRAQRLSIESGVLTMPRPDLEIVLHFKRH